MVENRRPALHDRLLRILFRVILERLEHLQGARALQRAGSDHHELLPVRRLLLHRRDHVICPRLQLLPGVRSLGWLSVSRRVFAVLARVPPELSEARRHVPGSDGALGGGRHDPGLREEVPAKLWAPQVRHRSAWHGRQQSKTRRQPEQRPGGSQTDRKFRPYFPGPRARPRRAVASPSRLGGRSPLPGGWLGAAAAAARCLADGHAISVAPTSPGV
mmetsp:Transcript_116875/g.337715  ORF Transcript_116875/g.337715 Transcript_116875/m.337715 type:complete len:217 (-) Transcript_116875:430-1080(-)